ncbi:DUF5011 domain-containing protein [Rummeliibacillus sp. NPDC094406]|uniref:DUF5011 domain-containing protein n=1 Tax=Rummeliibacillus sp. NPDC094406 TaxID=3364511 RepID=UPI0038285320
MKSIRLVLLIMIAFAILGHSNEVNAFDGEESSTILIPSNLETLEVGEKEDLAITVITNGQSTTVNSNITWTSSDQSIAKIDSNKIIPLKKGNIVLNVVYKNISTNFKVNITDTKAPILSGVDNKTIYKGTVFNAKKGISAKDANDGNITNKIKISGKVNSNKIGTYKLTYTVVDSSGNKTTKNRTITVRRALKDSFYKETVDGWTMYGHKNIINKKGDFIYKNNIALIPTMDKKYVYLLLVTEHPKIKPSQIKFTINKKSKIIKLKENGASLTKSEIAFLKNNITSNSIVEVELKNSKSKVKFKLNQKQVDALIDSVKWTYFL